MTAAERSAQTTPQTTPAAATAAATAPATTAKPQTTETPETTPAAATAAATAPAASYRGVLANRRLAAFVVGDAVSKLGDGMTFVALPVLALRLHGTVLPALAVALVTRRSCCRCC